MKKFLSKIKNSRNYQIILGICILLFAIPVTLDSVRTDKSKESEIMSIEINETEEENYDAEYETIEAPDDGGTDRTQNTLEETDFWKIADYPLTGILDLKNGLNSFLKERGYSNQVIHFITTSLKTTGGVMTYDVKIGDTNDLVHVTLYTYDVKHEYKLDKGAYKAAE